VGEQKLFFDDVNEGDTAPEKPVELTRTDLVTYAGASGDFNPMHRDEVAAKAAGLPSVTSVSETSSSTRSASRSRPGRVSC
jgi:acyl dehydratase